MYKYQPKRPVKSFQDLNVFQKTYNLSITITKNLTKANKLISCASEIPKLIATAHSLRFGDQNQAITDLEQAMLNCNLAVLYLMRQRDLHPNAKIDFNQLQKDYLIVRRKIMRLQKSWLRFMEINKQNAK